MVVTVAGLAALPAVAPASTATTQRTGFSSKVLFEAANGEANDITVEPRRSGRFVAITDAGTAIDPGKGCRGGEAVGETVLCRTPESRPQGLPAGFFPQFVSVRFRLGDGDDRYSGAGLPRKLQGTEAGRASVHTRVDGGAGADAIEGGATDDVIRPGPGDDQVNAERGLDSLRAEAVADGTDLLDGGQGDDGAVYSYRNDPVTISLDDIANDGVQGEGDQLLSIEGAVSGNGNDQLFGDAGRNDFGGRGGDDVIVGFGGRDSAIGDDIVPAPGIDSAGEARDVAGDDFIDGGEGDDEILGMYGEDLLFGGPGNDEVDGSLGVILAIFDAKSDPDRAMDDIDCGAGRDRVTPERRDSVTSCEREGELFRSRFSRSAALYARRIAP